jgi:uncharacterized protein YggE
MNPRLTVAGAVVVAALLATAGVAGAFATGNAGPAQAQPQQQGELSDTITVGTSGEVQAQADRAVVRLAVVATGDEIETVRQDLASNASSMREALTDLGINSSQIQTSYYDISTNRRYGGGEGDEPEYRATHAFSVTVNDTDSVGEVIDAAATNGADEVGGVEFTLSADRHEQLRQDALEAAMDAARNEATTIAATEDLTVVGVDRITTTEYSGTPYQAEGVAMSADAGGSTSIDSGPVSVSASVTVVYDAE